MGGEVVARSHGWVITWTPRAGRRCMWSNRLHATRTLAWETLLRDSPLHRDAPTPTARKRRFERQGFRVHMGWLTATQHCQHGPLSEQEAGERPTTLHALLTGNDGRRS